MHPWIKELIVTTSVLTVMAGAVYFGTPYALKKIIEIDKEKAKITQEQEFAKFKPLPKNKPNYFAGYSIEGTAKYEKIKQEDLITEQEIESIEVASKEIIIRFAENRKKAEQKSLQKAELREINDFLIKAQKKKEIKDPENRTIIEKTIDTSAEVVKDVVGAGADIITGTAETGIKIVKFPFLKFTQNTATNEVANIK